jgi:DNA modification methylase
MTDLMRDVTVLEGDVRQMLRRLPARSVHAVVTSPPYWQLRDYGFEGQLGLERTPELYVKSMVKVFRQLWRVLRDDGTIWVNIGDSYSGNGGQYGNTKSTLQGSKHSECNGKRRPVKRAPGLKRGDLVGIPWMLAFALRKDGWYLRSDNVWHKPNGMPSSVTDRCTQNHEYLFLLSKERQYYFDQQAIAEPVAGDPNAVKNDWGRKDYDVPGQKAQKRSSRSGNLQRVYDVNVSNPGLGRNIPWEGATRNKRTVWTVATEAYEGDHYAAFPAKLVEPCVLAGCPPGGTVLDPFAGTGTTGAVAVAHGRKAVLIEGNAQYVPLIPHRVEQVVRRLREAPAPPPAAPEQMQLELR